ncbi:unnamed protein product [Spirodela intermedia]|uniref:MADS-box domain-containing protein n=1 Tax=Spirodela intermedia TaxID=51605 RepID=A0A7I8K6V2_SPIIN|nr:unnamed protein product [Spirodela intermedia]
MEKFIEHPCISIYNHYYKGVAMDKMSTIEHLTSVELSLRHDRHSRLVLHIKRRKGTFKKVHEFSTIYGTPSLGLVNSTGRDIYSTRTGGLLLFKGCPI